MSSVSKPIRPLFLFFASVGIGIVGVLFAHRLQTSTTGPAPTTASPPLTNSVSRPDAPAAPIPAEIPTASLGARIVFGADFATNGGCADHGNANACDLFSARLDLSTGAVSDVTRLTSTAESESYPAWNPNGTVAYASVFQTTVRKSIVFVDTTTGKTGTLVASGTWPEISPDGSTILYNATDTDTLMLADLADAGTSMGTPTALTGVARQEDPDYSPDGMRIVFHQILSDGAHGMVLDTRTGKTAEYADRSGHCGFSGNGDYTVCDNAKGGGLFKRPYEGGVLGEESLLVADLSPSVLSAYDDAFASCGGTSFNYPTFCGDNTHLLTSVSCGTGGSVSFSRLFLLTLSGKTVIYAPIGKALAVDYGGPGKSSWTVDCLPS